MSNLYKWTQNVDLVCWVLNTAPDASKLFFFKGSKIFQNMEIFGVEWMMAPKVDIVCWVPNIVSTHHALFIQKIAKVQNIFAEQIQTWGKNVQTILNKPFCFFAMVQMFG